MPVQSGRSSRPAADVAFASHELSDGIDQPAPCILIVDDDRSIRRLLRAILSDEGFNVVTAADGREGLDVAMHEIPDLVILDLQMPGMGGYECFQAMRNRGLRAPVLILSAHGARPACEELGADAALDKPFDPQDVVDHVMRLSLR